MLRPAAVLLLCAWCYSCGPAETPICVSANDLSAQYGYDKAAADAKYKGKTLIITGPVNDIRLDPHQVDIKTDATYVIRAIGQDFSSLRKGEEITVRCKGDGTLAPITVSSCVLVPRNTACIAEQKPAIDPNSRTLVELTLEPRLQGQSVVVSGTTNLKEGAYIGYEVEHETYLGDMKNSWFKDGNIVVRNGRYSGTVSIAGWPRGEIKVWVTFMSFLKEQPEWAKTLYGEGGKDVDGPTVKLAGQGIKRAEIEKRLIKN